MSWKQKRRTRPGNRRDELDEFTSSDSIDPMINPRIWWIQHQDDFPKLSQMALDIFSVPAMSAEVERVFSSTGLMITDRRNRLKEDIIEAVECLKSWQKDGAGIIIFHEVDHIDALLEQLDSKGPEAGSGSF